MICLLENTARDYAWGSTHLISDYFGTPATGGPMAEIWYGTHPGSEPTVSGGGTLLQLRHGQELPFLFKVLAAGTPLSIQAHPNPQQAIDGFARENAAGIPLDASHRNYKDSKHKPEMIVALTPFWALVGFKQVATAVADFELLAQAATSGGHRELADALSGWASQLEQQGIEPVMLGMLAARGELDAVTAAFASLAANADQDLTTAVPHLKFVPELEELYAGDPGIFVSLLMNILELQPNESVQLGAGVIHAYLHGLGLEVMASSDNVLRGGLTPKHIDLVELARVLDFGSLDAVPLQAKQLAHGLFEYPRAVADYLMYRVEVSGSNLLADIKLANPAIAICTSGEVAIGDSKENRLVLSRGQVAYLADANFFSFSGSGTVFLATY